MNIRPLHDRVVVRRMEEERKTASGIIIPDNAKEKPLSGIVKAVSEKIKEKGTVEVGDKVIFAKYAGNELTIDGKTYLVMNLDDILGVL